jgi:hypothetical protein
MGRPWLVDCILLALGLGILAGLGSLVFVLASEAVPRDLRWVFALCLLTVISVFAMLAAWLAFRGDEAWVRSFLKVAPNDARLEDSTLPA